MPHLFPSRLFATAALLLFFAGPLQAQNLRELDWLDLLTDADREAMLTLPEIDHGSGAETDSDAPIPLDQQIANTLQQAGTPAQREAQAKWDAVLKNKRVRQSLNGARVKLPGFIVPLQTAADGRVTEFFLVPYFGACIHVPPPPSNQIIDVHFEPGTDDDNLYDAILVSGRLTTETYSHEMGTAGYRLEAYSIQPFETSSYFE